MKKYLWYAEEGKKVERELWYSMLDADMNTRYWSKLVKKYSAYETNSKIFLAVLSSGSVAGWQLWSQHPTIWQSLSCASALVSVILPVIKLPKMISRMSDLSGRWVQIQTDYELLWLDYNMKRDNKQLPSRYKNIKKREVSAKKIENDLPHSKKLLDQAYFDVHQSRGLQVKTT